MVRVALPFRSPEETSIGGQGPSFRLRQQIREAAEAEPDEIFTRLPCTSISEKHDEGQDEKNRSDRCVWYSKARGRRTLVTAEGGGILYGLGTRTALLVPVRCSCWLLLVRENERKKGKKKRMRRKQQQERQQQQQQQGARATATATRSPRQQQQKPECRHHRPNRESIKRAFGEKEVGRTRPDWFEDVTD